MKKNLVVEDMQNDFITGPLGTPEAVAIVDKVCEKIRDWHGQVWATYDTHDRNTYFKTQEGQKLPIIHCDTGSDGWYLPEVINEAINYHPYKRIIKSNFASVVLANEVGGLGLNEKDIELTLVGVCTDICVISNALLLKAHYPEMKIVVDASCCAGTTPEKHRMALEVMKSCQIDVVNDINPKEFLEKHFIIPESEG